MDRFSGLLRGVEKTNLGIGEKAIREVEVVLFLKVQLGCEIKLVIVAVLAAGGVRVCSPADPGRSLPTRIPVQDFAGRSRGIQPVQKSRCLNLRIPLRNFRMQYARNAAERAAGNYTQQSLHLE